MEPKNQNVLLAQDLVTLVSTLYPWSTKGFQNFLESGVLHDVIEFAKGNEVRNTLALIYEINQNNLPEKDSGDVTLPQIIKLLEAVPLVSVAFWDRLILLLVKISVTATWWKTNKPSWQKRDEWRVNMGLKRLNPIFRSKDEFPVEVTFKKIGKEKKWGQPLAGYRYATFEEVRKVWPDEGFPYEVQVLTKEESGWHIGSCPVLEEYVSRCFDSGFTQRGSGHATVCVAIVNL